MRHIHIQVICFLWISFSCLVSNSQNASGPVASYSFNDGTPKDNVGSNNAKAVGLSLTEDRFGNANSAYYFHGSHGSYMNLGTSNVLKPVMGSICLWFKMDAVIYSGRGIESNPIIITKCQPGNDFYEAYYIDYYFTAKKLGVSTTFSERNQVSLSSMKPIRLTEWYHVVMTYDNDFLCLYVNGVLENKTAKNFETHFLQGDSVVLGNTANVKNQRFFKGSIDDIKIYNRVITPQEVSDIYHEKDPHQTNPYVKWAIVCFSVFALMLLVARAVYIVYKRRLHKQHQLQVRLNELETKAIRIQMNPHFMFNALNTLQRFILEEDTGAAHLYLSRFSSLLRKLLESSTSDKITIEEELDILTTYIEIEKLRFNNSFEYKIVSDPSLDHVHIPVMIIQPFVENAIWHGLIPKKGLRRLEITVSVHSKNTILCVVDDDGVGRHTKSLHQDPFKKKSLATGFVIQRLELISKSTGAEGSVHIIDKLDPGMNSLGTRVEIIIPILK